jgi:uncharacterized protein (DUF2147 family)
LHRIISSLPAKEVANMAWYDRSVNMVVFPAAALTIGLIALALLRIPEAWAQLRQPPLNQTPGKIPPPKQSQQPSNPSDVTGLWIDHTGRGAVDIGPCGDRLCGRIAWVKKPFERSKRGETLCGLQVLGDLQRQPNNAWDAGWIYDPEEGERYSVEIKLRNAGTLQVTGYLGVKWLSETYLWKRAPAALERCGPSA